MRGTGEDGGAAGRVIKKGRYQSDFGNEEKRPSLRLGKE